MRPRTTTTVYRVYIYLGKIRYYANRLDETTTTWRVRWSNSLEEYPEHWSKEEGDLIRLKYLDQAVKYEEIYLAGEEEA